MHLPYYRVAGDQHPDEQHLAHRLPVLLLHRQRQLNDKDFRVRRLIQHVADNFPSPIEQGEAMKDVPRSRDAPSRDAVPTLEGEGRRCQLSRRAAELCEDQMQKMDYCLDALRVGAAKLDVEIQKDCYRDGEAVVEESKMIVVQLAWLVWLAHLRD